MSSLQHFEEQLRQAKERKEEAVRRIDRAYSSLMYGFGAEAAALVGFACGRYAFSLYYVGGALLLVGLFCFARAVMLFHPK